ncbi:chaperone modulator CbpM [Erwinia sp. P7711]|uniref:chaperone modulator CbpM n=1 Tax=unclassified Erwinia TaxID=2622719 RepID=UPI002990189C|nr:chaperone modulator CbpM [Erwinia sp. MMLR14_017]MDW8845136.1 chaperone modulator CbpM [Erwinia sp. MMLR14_017]
MTEHVRYTVIEICRSVDISPEELTEVVGLGVITPTESEPQWVFDYYAVHQLRRARRLQIELDLEWSGIALALTLLDKVDRLEKENLLLRRQLERLLHSG